ncbi:Zinc finger, BED-type [Sesbania bispinosa]|nr:Zinc finger, BED-type [Sesbania bispinosa]
MIRFAHSLVEGEVYRLTYFVKGDLKSFWNPNKGTVPVSWRRNNIYPLSQLKAELCRDSFLLGSVVKWRLWRRHNGVAAAAAIRHGRLASEWRASAILKIAAVMAVTAWRWMAAVAAMAGIWAFSPFFPGLGPSRPSFIPFPLSFTIPNLLPLQFFFTQISRDHFVLLLRPDLLAPPPPRGSGSVSLLRAFCTLLRPPSYFFSSAHVLLSAATHKGRENQTQSNTQPLTGASSNSIHPKRTDVAWKHCTPVRENDTNEIFCNYCRKVMKGGITRGKQHLIGKAGNVTACLLAPEAVKVEIRSAIDGKKLKQNEAFKKAIQDIEALNEEGCMEIGSSGDFSLKDTRKGPMDLYTQPQSTAAKNRKAKVVQAGIRELCDKKATERVYQSIARFWYQADIPFNLIKLESFHDMLRDVGHFGKQLKPPSYHDIRVPLL